MAEISYDRGAVQKSLRQKIRRAAARAIAKEDVWSDFDKTLQAERVVRHMYHPNSQRFFKDETIVKIETEPFTHGAMRHCFRMKKLATPPASATNHRFHSYGWSRALNYVAKAYMIGDQIDSSDSGVEAVLSDVLLQYEAMKWAEEFNRLDPPKKIDFIRAYALQFVDREGQPMFAVERFIDGRDSYGRGFLKHNTNSGFVDEEQRRKTPQVFSAHSFYASNGTRLVADVQGVGDLYTDPQVLSIDFRFGDGDLGPRGMALFFKSFKHSDLADGLGIPIFPLSRNEKRTQLNYDDDDSTISSVLEEEKKCRFEKLDDNRATRKMALRRPSDLCTSDSSVDTARRCNMGDMSKVIKQSMRNLGASHSKVLKRTKSDVDEIETSLSLALTDTVFDHSAFHRMESGEVILRGKPASQESDSSSTVDTRRELIRRSTEFKSIKWRAAPPMKITNETKINLGTVHYHLACLHGMDRFPEVVPESVTGASGDSPSHDITSVIFHLCHAASLYCAPACLALARSRVGLGTSVSPLLGANVPVDFESAKALCERAMAAKRSSAAPKIAAACLLFQIQEDEGTCGITEKIRILEEILSLMTQQEGEDCEVEELLASQTGRSKADGFKVGDKVEANYEMEGTFYPGKVVAVSEDGNLVTVEYEDDGSSGQLTIEHVKSLEPATEIAVAAATARLSDEEALGTKNSDEEALFEDYDLMAKLAELKEGTGDKLEASRLFQEASELAMTAGKMKMATELSMKAAALEE